MDSTKFIILAGPSSVGKTVIADRLLEIDNTFAKVVNTTTREPRHNERNGIDYHFVDDAQFQRLIDQGALFEHEMFNNHWYGTSHTEMNRIKAMGKSPVWIIDPKGALKIDKLYPNTLTIFIQPESLNQLRKRLELRNFTQEEINNRLRIAQEELTKVDQFDFTVLNREDDLDNTVQQILAIIRAN